MHIALIPANLIKCLAQIANNNHVDASPLREVMVTITKNNPKWLEIALKVRVCENKTTAQPPG